MSNPKAVRLRDYEESYVNQQATPFSDIVREPLTKQIVSEAIGVCAATGTLQYNSDIDPLDTPDLTVLQERLSGNNITPYKDLNQQGTTTHTNEDMQNEANRITNSATQIAHYPFTNNHDQNTDYFAFDWLNGYPNHIDVDTHRIWTLETMAIETTGGKQWDYLISLHTTLAENIDDISEGEYLSIAYMRGLAIMEMLSEAVTTADSSDEVSRTLETALNDLIEWMAHIEAAHAIPAHNITQHTQRSPKSLYMDAIAGVDNINVLDEYATKALDYNISIPASDVIYTPAGGNQRNFTDNTIHTLEWSTTNKQSESSSQEQLTRFYPATAILAFNKHTSKALSEWFKQAIESAHADKTCDETKRLKVGSPDDEQNKFVVVPRDSEPTWKCRDGEYLLIIGSEHKMVGEINSSKQVYVSSDTFSWCRYDKHQDEWVVYEDNNQLRYKNKKQFEENWKYIRSPNIPTRPNEPDYTLNATTMGEMGLPHEVTEIKMARQIYRNAREQWDSEDDCNQLSRSTNTQDLSSNKTAKLKSILNSATNTDAKICLVGEKDDFNTQTLSKLPKSITDDMDIINPDTINDTTLAAISLLEPSVSESHSQYNEEIAEIASTLRNQIKIDEYWGVKMGSIFENTVTLLIESDQIYTPTDLYEILIQDDDRQQFLKAVKRGELGASTDVTASEEIYIEDLSEFTTRLEQMDQEDIEPVVRRLQDIAEHPEEYTN